MDTLEIQEDFEALKSAIYRRRPGLGEALAEHGAQTLLEYAAVLRHNPRPVQPVRQAEFSQVMAEAAASHFGQAAGESVERQLLRHYYVSTTDHLGILHHPFFINGDIMSALPYADAPEADHENTIVLACGNISLNNSSWPRSLSFHAPQPHSAQPERFNLFSAADHLAPVFRFRPFSVRDLDKLRQQARARYARQGYPDSALQQFESLLDEVYGQPEILDCRFFSEQITRSNALLWQKFFQASGTRLPNLVYLQMEDIVLALLRRHHITAKSELHDFIFSKELAGRIEEAFDDVPGAFSRGQGKGTFLFWYFPPDSRTRLPLRRQGNEVVSLDGNHRVPLDPAHIGDLLEKRQLIPSMMLCLVTLACYYGVKCLGGFSQVDYLGRMDKAYAAVFGRTGEQASHPFTQGLCGELVLATLAADQGMVAATGFDLILYGDEAAYSIIRDNARQLRLGEAVALMMPEFYRILYREGERQDNISAITPDMIYCHLKLQDRLRPCLVRRGAIECRVK